VATLSVIIITYNEADMIRQCLESVAWADEIIVVDSNSTDNTVKICREFTKKITITKDWPGFGAQKNRALDRATGDWVLSIDADEVVSEKLKASIKATLSKPTAEAYYLKRQTFFLGKLIRFGDWRGDKVLRLFKRGTAKFSDEIVHERLIPTGKTQTLHGDLWHYSYQTKHDVATKLARYSDDGAAQAYARGKKSNPYKAVLRAGFAFFRDYMVKAGFLDGIAGFRLALYIAHYTYLRHIKLWRLTRQKHAT